MKKRWLLNLVLLAIVASISAFLHLRPQADKSDNNLIEISSLKMAQFNSVSVEYPAKAAVSFTKNGDIWKMASPYKTRADQMSVQRILTIIAAKSSVKLPVDDLAKFGLDQPAFKLNFSGDAGSQVFTFGTHNPVTEEQYVAFQDSVYLLPVSYAEAATTQPIEMVDKSPLTVDEKKQLIGYNFSYLEQWQELGGLTVDLTEDGKWNVSLAEAKPVQDEMNDWSEFSWRQGLATSVEFYTPNRHQTLPSFDVKLKNGEKVHFEKIQESPEYLLGRPDEGIIYHFPNDVGFSMVNPPLHNKE